MIGQNKASLGQIVDGWVITKGVGAYGTDYMKRAVVAAFGWPANLEQDAVYPYTEVDSEGATTERRHKYTLTFAKDRTPPVNGFWSITMYEIDQGWWFVPNALEQVHGQPAQRPQIQCRWLADAPLPEQIAGRGQGGELAAGAEGRVPADAAHVLAEGDRSLHPERQLDAAAGGEGALRPRAAPPRAGALQSMMW